MNLNELINHFLDTYSEKAASIFIRALSERPRIGTEPFDPQAQIRDVFHKFLLLHEHERNRDPASEMEHQESLSLTNSAEEAASQFLIECQRHHDLSYTNMDSVVTTLSHTIESLTSRWTALAILEQRISPISQAFRDELSSNSPRYGTDFDVITDFLNIVRTSLLVGVKSDAIEDARGDENGTLLESNALRRDALTERIGDLIEKISTNYAIETLSATRLVHKYLEQVHRQKIDR